MVKKNEKTQREASGMSFEEITELVEKLAKKRFENLKREFEEQREKVPHKDSFSDLALGRIVREFRAQIINRRPISPKSLNQFMARQFGLNKGETRKVMETLVARGLVKSVKRGYIIPI